MLKRILGLDISSTTIGICLLEWDSVSNKIKPLSIEFYKPSKKGTILERLSDTRNQMANIISQLRPDFIALEDIISFMPHRSSANTIITLAVFNRCIGLLSFDYTGHPPALFSVMDIRRGLQRGEIVPKKEEMPELVAAHLAIPFPWLRNKKGKIKIESYDLADSMAVALFYVYVLSGKLPMPVHIKKKRPKKLKLKVKKRKVRKKFR